MNNSSNVYGPTTISDHASVHLGDIFYSYRNDSHTERAQEEKTKALKSTLYYSTMDDRRAQLEMVEPSTFDWVWQGTAFPEWLGIQAGVFWISGKPGSGKSTLMHYLAEDEDGAAQVRGLLPAAPTPWLLVHYYFDFRAADGLANSAVGMLRSMLLQLVKSSHAAERFVLKQCEHRLDGKWPDQEKELTNLFCKALKHVEIPICAFVDGIDEFQGRLRGLVDNLLRLQKQSNIKLCVASRPEPELSFRLQNFPQITMEQHNRSTIVAYIEGVASSLTEYVDESDLDALLDHVLANAHGVILWARFAIDEIVDAALSGQGLSNVWQCLESFPPELESIYVRIWTRLNEQEKLHAAALLLIVKEWQSSFEGLPANAVPLFVGHLQILWMHTVEQLSPSMKYDASFSEKQFRLRTHHLVGGLIEFVPIWHPQFHRLITPRLAHKSLQTFLDQDPEFQTFSNPVKKQLNSPLIGPTFYAQTFVDASEALVPISGRLGDEGFRLMRINKSNCFRGHRVVEELQPLIESIPFRKDAQPITRSAHAVTLAVTFLPDLMMMQVYNLRLNGLLAAAGASWLFHKISFPLELQTTGIGVNELYQSSPEWLQQHMELQLYLYPSATVPFQAAMNRFPDLPQLDREFLAACGLSLLSARGPSLQREQIVSRLLEGLPWEVYYLALSVSRCNTAFFSNIMQHLAQKSFGPEKLINPAPWWHHDSVNALCSWVWSPSLIWDVDTQRSRLDVLLGKGFHINDPIGDVGNAMHALFLANPWRGKEYLPNPYNVRLSVHSWPQHFSTVKFDLLLKAGIDITREGKFGTCRSAALRLKGILEGFAIIGGYDANTQQHLDNKASLIKDHILIKLDELNAP